MDSKHGQNGAADHPNGGDQSEVKQQEQHSTTRPGVLARYVKAFGVKRNYTREDIKNRLKFWRARHGPEGLVPGPWLYYKWVAHILTTSKPLVEFIPPPPPTEMMFFPPIWHPIIPLEDGGDEPPPLELVTPQPSAPPSDPADDARSERLAYERGLILDKVLAERLIALLTPQNQNQAQPRRVAGVDQGDDDDDEDDVPCQNAQPCNGPPPALQNGQISPAVAAGVETLKDTLDATYGVLKDMMGAFADATVGTVDPVWLMPECFRVHSDGVIVRFIRRLGFNQPKSIGQPDTAITTMGSKVYVPPHLRRGFERVMRLQRVMQYRRFTMSQKLTQYVLVDVETIDCVKARGAECKCAYCVDLRLSSDLSMQLRRRDAAYATYVRMEVRAYGLVAKTAQFVRVPIAICQEFLRRNSQHAWLDSEFHTFWSECVGRINVDCRGLICEEMLARQFCRDWHDSIKTKLVYHMGLN